MKIINLFREEDDPTFGMTHEEKLKYWDKVFAKYKKKTEYEFAVRVFDFLNTLLFTFDYFSAIIYTLC